MKAYDATMKPFNGKGILFRAHDQSAFFGHEVDRHCGWSGLFNLGLDVHNVPGDHLGVISEQHVNGLATTLRRYLDIATKKFS
jgi:thioesterase domain-containing protein